MSTIIGSYNEWGRLREAMVGIADDLVFLEYMPAMSWMTEWAIEAGKKYGGSKVEEIAPEKVQKLREQIERFVEALEKWGVKVHRNIPLRYKEEKEFLDNTQKGCYLGGGAGFFRVIGKTVILMGTNLRFPARRKQIYSVRPVLEKLIADSDARYVSMPPASPHYSEDDIYLENGDIMVDGTNVYVGISDKASNKAGADWLQRFLGAEYKVYIIEKDPDVFHLDCLCSLTRPGLLTYYPDFVGELPEPLRGWDKIEVYREEGEEEAFGANTLTLDENTVILAEQYERVAAEYRARGIETITLPLDVSIEFGAGSRCLTGILRRDP